MGNALINGKISPFTMQVTNELNALLSLIDDPDTEVYESVSGKLLDYGKPIIPNLEYLWENQPDEKVQERIEGIIRKLQLAELSAELVAWRDAGCQDLLTGALLVSKYDQPDLTFDSTLDAIESLRKNIWLELNNFLTPLEQAKVMSNLIYQYFQLKGNQLRGSEPDDFFLFKVIRRKQGNSLTNALLYQALSQQLNVDAALVAFPHVYMLAFYSSSMMDQAAYPPERASIQFFVDPVTGKAYTQQDVEMFFKRLNIEPAARFFSPLSNQEIISKLLQEAAMYFREINSDCPKAKELFYLYDVVMENIPAEKNERL
jgi:regulator of sirC expression with transglutaminase-like and TPR domain